MKKALISMVAIGLTLHGPAASAFQGRERNETVKVTVVDSAGKAIDLATLARDDRQRIRSLREALQQWSNDQGQRVTVTISCKYPPLSCTVTIQF